MPIEKRPAKLPNPFPPSGGAGVKVGSGMTWGSIAAANGLAPLDLIRFNFGTTVPSEVNWCLRQYVGCCKHTIDGRNWIFSETASPGIVYVPAKAPPTPPPVPVPAAPSLPAGLLAEEEDVTAGPLRANDAYDLRLSRTASGDYDLLCFMKLQFFFESGTGGDWTAAEKTKFMKDWEVAVKTAWGGRVIKTLPTSKKKVYLRFGFSIQEGGWMFDHWELTVTKITAGSFRTSYVNVGKGNVTLDSEDLTPVSKSATTLQRGAVHEFGHMLGLDDEYTAGSPFIGEKDKMMNSGEVISMRYDAGFMNWLDTKVAELGLD